MTKLRQLLQSYFTLGREFNPEHCLSRIFLIMVLKMQCTKTLVMYILSARFFKVDTQEEAIKILTSAKERVEKEKYKLGKL